MEDDLSSFHRDIWDSFLIQNAVLKGKLNNGGGMFLNMNCNVTISNVSFAHNKADGGGAIYAQNLCNISILHNSSFMSNTGSAVMLVDDNTLHINNSKFHSNSRAIFGMSNCNISIVNTNFIHNKASYGGSIRVSMESSVNLQISSFYYNSAKSHGGAIIAENSTVTVFACNFNGNMAKYGGVFTISGILFVNDSLVANNTAGNEDQDGDGAVVHLEEKSQIYFTNSTFRANRAFHRGGVLWMRRSTATIRDSSFVQNRAESSGGVIYAEYSEVNMKRSACLENNATNGHGGIACCLKDTEISVSDSTIKQSYAHACGALYVLGDSVLQILSSQVEWNSASVSTGVLCVLSNSSFVATNSSFKENIGNLGGALEIQNSTGYLESCTFMDNLGIYAGAITVGNAELRLSNTIFVQNISHFAADIDSRTRSDSFKNKFYTWKCLFVHDNKTLSSNSSSFKQMAVKQEFIIENGYAQNNFATEETQFASSKIMCVKLISF